MLNEYYKSHMESSERAKYESLVSGLNLRKTSVMLHGILEESTTQAILADHPELFFCNLREIQYLTSPIKTIAMPQYCISATNTQTIEQKAFNIAAKLPSAKTEETVRVIHNYIVKNIEYDYVSGQSNSYEHDGHTVIGPLMKGKGVCEGLSLTFKWLLDIKGIDNTTVTGKYGELGNDIYHMWNVVSIQGRNYYIDITQDISTTNKAWGKPSYMFYMLTEEEIRQDHVFNESFNCHNTIDNPFYKAGRVFSNIRALEQYIRSLPAGQRLINFKYTGSEGREVISRVVQQAVRRHPLYPKMSITENYGRYYCFKEK